jgi:hypothetical protein
MSPSKRIITFENQEQVGESVKLTLRVTPILRLVSRSLSHEHITHETLMEGQQQNEYKSFC